MNVSGKNNPFYGRKHTAETKRKMSEAKKGYVPWNKGRKSPKTSQTLMRHTLSEETRKKISDTLKKRYLEGMESPFKKGHNIRNTGRTRFKKGRISHNKGKTIDESYGVDQANVIRDKLREGALRHKCPTKNTSIEIAFFTELDKRGIEYEKHRVVCGICKPDIVFPKNFIAVQCDGYYWHSLPNMIEKDIRQGMVLRENGWLILRYWEHEIINNIEGCVDEVEEVVLCPNH